VEHPASDVIAMRFQQIAGVSLFGLACLGIDLFQNALGGGVPFQQIRNRCLAPTLRLRPLIVPFAPLT
jgi:hypothetical protein